jgi:hypothetical protein
MHTTDQREQLQAVLNDLDAGRIRLRKGQDNYRAELERRISALDRVCSLVQR